MKRKCKTKIIIWTIENSFQTGISPFKRTDWETVEKIALEDLGQHWEEIFEYYLNKIQAPWSYQNILADGDTMYFRLFEETETLFRITLSI